MPIIAKRKLYTNVAAYAPAASAPAALALDGTAAGDTTFAGATTVTATITTTTANDIIVACITRNSAAILSIADGAGLTWNLISNLTTGNQIAAYYAKSTSILTSNTVTVTFDGPIFGTLHLFAVKGANFTTPLDANGALPATTASLGEVLSLTTSTADGFLFGTYRFQDTFVPTVGSGWTVIQAGNWHLTEYKIVSSAQTGTSVPIGGGVTDQQRGIGHSVRA